MPTEPKPTLSLHRKLAQVMYEAERIPKRGKAPAVMGGYPFVQVGDAADFIRKALAEKVVTMMPTSVQVVGQVDRPTKAGGSMTTVDLIVEWTLTDGESGETITIMSFGAGADGGDKYSGKATTTAMKYALLSGFLLSTGEDSELGTSEAAHRPRAQAAPEPPQIAQDGLIGTVEKGKPPVDMEPRQTPNGMSWGFKLKDGSRSFQVLATGSLADVLSMVPDLTGQRVQVFGTVEMVPWNKGEKAMPPFARIHLARIVTPEFTLPAEGIVEPDEAATAPLFDDVDAA